MHNEVAGPGGSASAEALRGGIVDRAQGCLLGQLVGDALGSMVEFMSARDIARLYPHGLREIGPSPVHGTIAGQPTDDSELALALARSLVARGGYDEEDVAGAYTDWLESGPFDKGGTITRATHAMGAARGRGERMAAAGRVAASRSSEANGALMRQCPLAIWGYSLAPEALALWVRADTLLTHPHPVCQGASAAFLVALAAVIRDGLDGRAAHAVAREWDRLHGQSPIVTTTLAAAALEPPAFQPNEGHVVIALQNAFYQAYHAQSFEEGLVATVMCGGDTDTNAAIAGALLGAIHGVSAIPEQWRTAVLQCRPERGRPEVRQHRPEVYWPVDALALAEALLHTGTSAGREGGGGGAVEAAGAAPIAPAIASDARFSASTGTHVQVPESNPLASDPRVWPGAGDADRQPMHDTPLRSRFRAALLGGAMGDALGRPAEGSRTSHFGPAWPITDYQRWPGYRGGRVGTITDDTQLTIVVAECLLANGWLDPEDLARRLIAWLPGGRGKGAATTQAVQRLTAGIPWYLAGEDSAGNGAAMRAAPIGLLRRANAGQLRAEAVLSALPTHRNPMGVAGAVAMAAATAWLLGCHPGKWTPSALVAAIQAAIVGLETEPQPERRPPGRLTTLHDRLGELPALLEQPPEQVLSYLYNGAYVLESVPAALYCFMRSPDNMEQSLLLAANAGYDADSVAAMAGTLGGALGGEAALPQHLLPELEYREKLLGLADGLWQKALEVR